ncbi:MAG: hypothetical protein CMJ75_01245 [Planctomycetaceae bacterium]|nr:hypothetical protein [Planctomycetaceae bacterium]
MSLFNRTRAVHLAGGPSENGFLVTLLVVACLSSQPAASAENLLTDPTFGKVSDLQHGLPDHGWCWQRIQTPCKVTTSRHQHVATLHGGKVFLDSAPLPLAPSTKHEFRLQVSGTATFSVELLAWTASGLPAQPHRVILQKAAPLPPGTLDLRTSFRSPADMSLGQIRLIASQGTAVVRAPSLSIPIGTLLLSLDAAQPGPRPATHWQDLTGQNRDLTVGEQVRYAADRQSYVFAAAGARCCGALEDAPAFDFETDTAAGAGHGDAFTVVFYAKLTDGHSGPGIVNKLATAEQRGWAVGLVFDQFGLDRVTTFQQSNRELRTINGFPGLAGQTDARLNVRDGDFHCFIVHFTGSGQRDGSVYIDGSTKSLALVGWPFGNLSSGTIRNTTPLCIGAFGERGFRGEIGFVEIWSGTRLTQGMTPAAYSRYRYRRGVPRRGTH